MTPQAGEIRRLEAHEDLRLMNEHEAAAFLGYTIRALQNWRVRGGGPRFVRVSARSIRYRRKDLVAWSEERLAASTSDVCHP
ncbi:MAG: helix-turn-helix domain-containing protein [Geminicoccaceae bacterium]|nr:helix-turn-helix domain-containing protein [Geminicoccaceae bacterium]